MVDVTEKLIELQNTSDKMFFEIEEKRMKMEDRQRKEEREFQLKMLQILCGTQQVSPPHIILMIKLDTQAIVDRATVVLMIEIKRTIKLCYYQFILVNIQ